MIEIHADDYGMFVDESRSIIECINEGCVNGISIMPNSEHFDESMKMLQVECDKNCMISVHLDLITGKAMLRSRFLADEEGYFKNSYGKLMLISLIPFIRSRYKADIKAELSEQINKCIPYMNEKGKIRIDSHRHFHMIPMVFAVIMDIVDSKGLELEYIRMSTDSYRLYDNLFSYETFRPINVIKSILLSIFKCINELRFRDRIRGKYKKFASILFSGCMTKSNMIRILDRISICNYQLQDYEIMVHPGGVVNDVDLFEIHNQEDREFLQSKLRMVEYTAVKDDEVLELIDALNSCQKENILNEN